MTTSKPEVCTLGGEDIIVIAGCPGTAGAGSTRQRADGAFDYGGDMRGGD